MKLATLALALLLPVSLLAQSVPAPQPKTIDDWQQIALTASNQVQDVTNQLIMAKWQLTQVQQQVRELKDDLASANLKIASHAKAAVPVAAKK